MPAVNNEKTEFSSRVPTAQYEEFRKLFPQYGATTWFITTALETFLAHVRDNPSGQEHVRLAIAQMVQENRDEPVV